MARAELEKYFRKTLVKQTTHPEVTAPAMGLKSDEGFGNLNLSIGWRAVTEPFVMAEESHAHDFDQFLIFAGGDLTNMIDLGGEVELFLSLDNENLEKFIITEATAVFIPAGLYHCPLSFTKINDPRKPILFQNIMLTSEYKRRS